MQIGDTYEIRGTVTEASTAQSVGSGGLPVFSTPYMIAMMENAAYTLLQRELPEGKTSVGTKLDVFHVAASPVGIGLRAEASVSAISGDGRSVEFTVSVWDDTELVGRGSHRRAIVDAARFLSKCESKLNK